MPQGFWFKIRDDSQNLHWEAGVKRGTSEQPCPYTLLAEKHGYPTRTIHQTTADEFESETLEEAGARASELEKKIVTLKAADA